MGSKCKNLLKDFWFIPVTVLIISGILISGFRLCFTIGESMVPTLSNREPLLLSTHEKTPERYDIIVFKKYSGESLIKRVIGLPGEKIQIKDNVIYINDSPIEDAVDVKMRDYGYLKDPIVLGENEYFAMGDNRNFSSDCRAFGPITQDQIVGTVICRLPSFEIL